MSEENPYVTKYEGGGEKSFEIADVYDKSA